MRKAIGIDIGGTYIRAALVSEDGSVLKHASSPTQPTAPRVVKQLDAMIADLSSAETQAIGIGIPGRVNAAKNQVYSGGFVDLSGVSLADVLTNAADRSLYIDNDASMALFAESRLGAARGKSHVVMLTIGTGIGGAVLLDGKIFHGHDTAGQLGHLTVDMNGEICACGRRGCIETTSSGTALARHLAAAGLSTAMPVDELLKRDDARSKNVIEKWTRPLRLCIDSLAAAFSPSIVILGGGLGQAAVKALETFPATSPWFQYAVIPAELGDGAGVVGAALAALDVAKRAT